jgi:PAS domain S-box-containing protein
MNRILLFLENSENRRLLEEFLSFRYEVRVGNSSLQTKQAVPMLDEPFDLCILDGVALHYLGEWASAKKEMEQPVFLPFLLVTPQSQVKLLTRQLWQSVDELISKPIEKLELQARVEMLLRSRQLSLQLKASNQQLQDEIAQRDRAEAEREVAIAALQDNELRFRRLTESNVIGMIVADLKGNIVDANQAFLNMVGYTSEELQMGTIQWQAMTPPEYQALDLQGIEKLRSTGLLTPFEKEYIHKDGNRVPVEVGGALLDSVEQTAVCFVLDISDRKRAEAETQRALAREREINELKSRFVYMVSHEFRNPLNIISGFVRLLERQGNRLEPERQADFYQRIKSAIDRMTTLLDDVLLIGETETNRLSFQPAPLEVISFCQSLVEDLKIANDEVEIGFIYTVESLNANLDSALLRNILGNLLSNAIKYSSAGSPVQLYLSCEADVLTFKVQDTGIGIPPEAQTRLFDAFYRANNVDSRAGTGLGLAIVKQSVDLHGGTISIESEVNVGTTFIVTLPVSKHLHQN